MKKWIVLAALMLVAFAYAGQYSAAQNATQPAPTARATVAPRATSVPQATWTAGPSSTVQINFVACANQAVVNLTGLLTSGRAIYYQVFNAAGGGGTALTGLRQVTGSGNYAVSEVVPYANDQTVAGGAVASVAVRIASSSNPNSIEFQTTVDDGQDGCNNPQNPETTSTDLGGAGGATSGGGSASAPPAGQILAPGGIVLNQNLQPEPQVVVGSRASLTYRSTTAGLVFAECDKYPQALPGIIYNTDKVTIFWSWYARTLQQVYDQRVHAQFSVKVNTAPLRNADVSEPAQIDGNYWIFYTVPLGNLRPGHYEVEFRQTWDSVISDGYTNFGPNTANDLTASNCNFDVTDLKSKDPVVYAEQYNPTNYAVHDLDAALDPGSQGG
jgi:hypothetical protein